ncbi:histidinol dehydrogenase [Lutibaculum baratangense]|uniref:Histidinol dehydrogenase n=1 Tax=Lutibaculum baratangense AMV1 TaxID=631454 RepID=V4TF81_9HYPH|nr:histidinol dehydrogenase [Lutibaculum baratangense]ESR24833.1 Histidinol dehydrogenase [Lutibaculum baratangense AMV1]
MSAERPTVRLSRHELARLSHEERERLLLRSEADLSDFIAGVQPIIADVKARGDEALADYGRRFDRAADLDPRRLAATEEEFDAAERRLDPELKDAMRLAAANIRRFHERQMPHGMWLEEMGPGQLAGERTLPIPSVACYVPRGKGAFPSVALMTAIPAAVAGVPEIVVLTPPTESGGIDDATLFACRLAGVTRAYRCGGAQAVAAVAYGTRTVPRCSKIVGPGSSWVVAAMHVLSNVIDVGPPAGPSESIVLADETADPRRTALDLLNEAEHGPDSSAYLVTNDPRLADRVELAVEHLWTHMSPQRVEFSRAVLTGTRGGIVIAPDIDEACRFVNDYAPEHLMVESKDPWPYLAKLTHAGEILLGEHSAISIANFVLGPNHVLPTGGWARTRSPLSVFDFTKRQTIACLSAEGLEPLRAPTRVFARYEGFDAHANAVSRLRDGGNSAD